jgi:hypothetical protein
LAIVTLALWRRQRASLVATQALVTGMLFALAGAFLASGSMSVHRLHGLRYLLPLVGPGTVLLLAMLARLHHPSRRTLLTAFASRNGAGART